jgi:hypothetical protein
LGWLFDPRIVHVRGAHAKHALSPLVYQHSGLWEPGEPGVSQIEQIAARRLPDAIESVQARAAL